LNDKIVG